MIPGITASTRRGAPEPPGNTIGEPLGGGFYAGDIEIDGQWYKLIVADISAEVYGLRWKTSNSTTAGTDHLTDGIAHNGGGHADWYMPSRDELNVVYTNLGFNRPDCPPDFQSGGAQAFHSSNYYWTSTQFSSDAAWNQRFSDGHQYYTTDKSATRRRVRPVRRIPFNP